MLTGQQNLRAVCGIKVSVASPSGGGAGPRVPYAARPAELPLSGCGEGRL